jgi:hypothetical protein
MNLPTSPTIQQSRPLFHYTTAQGLLGIVQDKCLFATHADFSNDSSECKLILPHLVGIIKEEYRRIVPELIALNIMSSEILRNHGEAVYEQEAENSVQAIIRATNNIAPYFITSFCIHEKGSDEYRSGLLSQWRGYGRGGFAVEFDELEIDELNKEERARWGYQGFISREVSYDDHEQQVVPEKFKGLAGAFLRQIIDEKSLNLTHILGSSRVEDFVHAFLSIAPLLKHRDFREEREYRIVALCNRRGNKEIKDHREFKDMRFRVRADSSVVPYIVLYEGRKEPLPIKSVIIGPHVRQEEQRVAIELLFERHDVAAEVRLSATPFRE